MGRQDPLVLTSATPMDHAELPQWAQRPGCQTLDYSAQRPKKAAISTGWRWKAPCATAETLADLLCAISDAGQRRTIVFVNHRERRTASRTAAPRRHRERALPRRPAADRSRSGRGTSARRSVPVLVVTDLAACGLDIEGGIDAVVHYHMPLPPTTGPTATAAPRQWSRRHRICHHRRR